MQNFVTLRDWLIYLETSYPVSIDMSLVRIQRVKAVLGLQFYCPVITVGGTNGKGSTCAILEAILLHAGYHVGCHTSPHLIKFNERARVDGLNATDSELLPHFEAIEIARLSLPQPVSLTYFEFTILAIMRLFAFKQLDVVILEVGMGGRLDAVNIIDTDCAVITSIDLDHQHYIGNTRELIGHEKAGIFRSNKPAIVSDLLTPSSMIKYAEAIGADLWLLNRDFYYDYYPQNERRQWSYHGRSLKHAALAYPALRGENQLLNATTAIAALEALQDRLPVSEQDIRLGLTNVELPGRFQVLSGKPAIVLDVAHNPHAAAVLAKNLANMGYFPYTYLVFGAMADKDVAGMLACLKDVIDYWCITELPISRAISTVDIEQKLVTLGVTRGDSTKPLDISIRRFSNPQIAYKDALNRASKNDRIVVSGSFYTISGVISSNGIEHY
ncbi:bifunctional tetrahydrofolate synthase/dihydrofolate synthase [Candidatus Vallotia lariciata]|uniref:bifunctional tetrahydrofolate synthase/dihydrofolate synthase n=1 Tax=Candidatus Vallotia laricis TaxID=2018052 RepID=UPI001D02EC0A|nr:bifunctional tetrahydrofolate synthase/dihydrofolate synthase [Candidatus Vallotia lariciata]UDG82969.1 Dihydrofolate synthase/folylpolyglutamate synthase [Candidatus Vallotia lariciata]